MNFKFRTYFSSKLKLRLKSSPFYFFRLVQLEWYRLKKQGDFSQFGEQEVLIHLFAKKKKGNYLDIGAGRPITRSNTFALYKEGWHGVTIDPIKSNQMLHKLFRPRDKFIRCLVGGNKNASLGLIDFYEFDRVDYSTARVDVAQALISPESSVSLRSLSRLPIIEIRTLYEQEKIEFVDLLSVDCEGMDFEIIDSIDWGNVFPPSVICIENYFLGKTDVRIQNLLTSVGYQLFAEKFPSSIYVHEDFIEGNRLLNG